jgi:hypothetical protein
VKFFRRSGTAVSVLLLLLAFPAAADAWILPDIPGFKAVEADRTPLEAPSGTYGLWLVRNYAGEGGRRMKATIMAGPGAGPLMTAPAGTLSDDRPLGFGSTYEVFLLNGKTAVFETIPSLGSSLAVAAGGDATLTLESSSLSREELERAASAILENQ